MRPLILASLVLASAACRDGKKHPSPAYPNLAAAGDVTESSAVLWTRADRAGLVVFRISEDPDFRSSRSATVHVPDPLVPAKARFDGLAPGTLHHYRVESNGPSGRFRTLPAPAAAAALRFGVGGDWRGDLAPFPAAANAADRDLDLFVALGDTVYADYASPAVPAAQAATLEEFRAKHAEVYTERAGLNTLARLRASTALLVTTDDHEWIDDFSGGAPPSSDPRFAAMPGAYINETPFFLDGLRAFQDYNPVADESYGATGDPRTSGKGKLYRSRRWGSTAALFLLDARSFRDAALPPVTDPTDPAQVGAFLGASFDPTRTMLGAVQVAELKADLLSAHAAGVCWKFVLVPEPIQNLGVLAASDRFEGYAAERTEILKFVADQGIANVAFVAADIHGMLVNNLSYQLSPLDPQVPLDAFEVTVPAVAYSAPLGPYVADLAYALGFITAADYALYQSLPMADQDLFVRSLLDGQVLPLGYDAIGLEGSTIDATLLQGGYVAAHVYGWTEFEIDAATRALTVTTWGIPWYSEADLAADPAGVASRQPAVVSRFIVQPK